MDLDYYLGVDIGTSSVKAIAFNASGQVLYEQSRGYAMFHPAPDRSEQDPEEIVHALFQCVENNLQHFQQPPELISFSSAMHSLMAIDEEGHPITKCIIWADNRAADIASRLHKENRAASFYFKTGVPVHAMSPFCKLLWLKENDPLLIQKAFKFIGIKEYVFYKLFGIHAVDSSIAAATGLMNIKTVRWDEEILEETGIRQHQLSPIVPVGKIFRLPGLFPLLRNTPFIIGGSDGALANLGTSSQNDHSLVVSIGTSCAARVIVRGPATDPDMRTFCYHVKNDLYLLGGAGNNGAIVLQWLSEKFFLSEKELPDFLAGAAQVPAGCEGLIFLPYILGERAPLWNAAARGVLFGLSVNHTREHVIRSAMEGVIYCVYSIGRMLLETRDIRQIFVTGGFAQNDLWVQMLSDVFRLPVKISETIENAAWGAVKLGMEALELNPAGEEKILSVIIPSAAHQQLYQQQFDKFERLYRLLKEEF
ncbi:MAG: gluconokinase [Bacteroidota bacterium]|nr:gluconokinase [Bacteroidota bacterium]